LPFRALADEAAAMMTAHIVYPRLDPQHPATLSRAILGDLLRREWGYDGVVITDSLVMKAIGDRYGHDRASVLALQAGADMVMALGTQQEQMSALEGIRVAIEREEIDAKTLARACARLDRLAERFPVRFDAYAADIRRSDDALMRRAWARGLTALDATPPPRNRPLRVITQHRVPGDGVSEPGVTGENVAQLFAAFDDVEIVQTEDLLGLDPLHLPQDGRMQVLASNIRVRYGERARDWHPDLHIILWNPFHALDVAAPSVVTWGYADGALGALAAWLDGRAAATGRAPVPLQNALSSATKS
jgi:beta-N-acetylhexosaminidase